MTMIIIIVKFWIWWRNEELANKMLIYNHMSIKNMFAFESIFTLIDDIQHIAIHLNSTKYCWFCFIRIILMAVFILSYHSKWINRHFCCFALFHRTHWQCDWVIFIEMHNNDSVVCDILSNESYCTGIIRFTQNRNQKKKTTKYSW